MGVHGHHTSHIKKFKNSTYSKYLLPMDAYTYIPKLYGMENITTKELMENLNNFHTFFCMLVEIGRMCGFCMLVEIGRAYRSSVCL